ncbi:hypothetical protein [Frigoribacterium sp. UYMn621]|uniref:hypothetical protein n=1 Tax=Frigoribacterium sp. UYMn621 TaxID=3156343 RepID=UPI00339607B8
MGKSTLVPEPNTPDAIIAAADAEVTEADALALELETAARGGDDSVTQAQVEDAKKRSGWARIRRDAAESKAAARAEEMRRQAYAALLDRYLPAASSDIKADVEAHLAEARPHIEAALELLGDRNKALWAIAMFTSDPSNYKDAADGIMADAPALMPGGSWFEYRGDRYAYLPASIVIRNLLKPLKPRIKTLSGGRDSDFVNAI